MACCPAGCAAVTLSQNLGTSVPPALVLSPTHHQPTIPQQQNNPQSNHFLLQRLTGRHRKCHTLHRNIAICNSGSIPELPVLQLMWRLSALLLVRLWRVGSSPVQGLVDRYRTWGPSYFIARPLAPHIPALYIFSLSNVGKRRLMGGFCSISASQGSEAKHRYLLRGWWPDLDPGARTARAPALTIMVGVRM